MKNKDKNFAEKDEYKKKAAQKKAEAKRVLDKKQMTTCSAIIHTATAVCSAAGVVPIPIVDAGPIAVAQVVMVMSLGKTFNQRMTKSAAKAVICAATGTFLGRNIVKLIPVGGWIASGVTAGFVTEAIGWTVAVDMARKQAKSTVSIADPFDSTTVPKRAPLALKDYYVVLNERAIVFLSGKKSVAKDKSEYDSLISDFERILDELDENDLLRQTYDQLFRLSLE